MCKQYHFKWEPLLPGKKYAKYDILVISEVLEINACLRNNEEVMGIELYQFVALLKHFYYFFKLKKIL